MATDEPQQDPRAGLSRRDLLERGGAFAGAFALGSLAAACGGGDGEEAAPAPPAEEGAAPPPPAEGRRAGGTVNWLSWPGHDDPCLHPAVHGRDGHQGARQGVLGRDNMLALATTLPPGTYDVVQADAEYIVQLKDAGLLEPLDLASTPSTEDYQEEFKPGAELVPGLVLDGDTYGLIQRFGFLGLAYYSEKVTEEEAQSYEILFDPKVQGKVGWFDWWAHMGPIGLYEGAKGAGGRRNSSIRTTSTRASSRRWSTRFSR